MLLWYACVLLRCVSLVYAGACVRACLLCMRAALTRHLEAVEEDGHEVLVRLREVQLLLQQLEHRSRALAVDVVLQDKDRSSKTVRGRPSKTVRDRPSKTVRDRSSKTVRDRSTKTVWDRSSKTIR